MKVIPFCLLLLCLFLSVIQSSFAQNSISGILKDQDHKPVEFATVGLYSAADSSLVESLISNEEGSFIFQNPKIGRYYIGATFIGYRNTYSETLLIGPSQNKIDTGVLTMESSSQSLETVTVTGQKSMMEMKQDRMVFNVENSIFSEGNTALELLEKAPGVTVDQDGNIAIKGKEGVRVMLNGRLSYLSQSELAILLKSTPSNTVSKIEVITNPSSKYDAAGTSGMLNIVLKQNNNFGFNGAINANGGRGRAGRYEPGTSLNYRNGKWNLFGSYNYSHRTEIEYRTDLRRFKENQIINRYSDQRTAATTNPVAHNFKFGADFTLSEKDIFGFIVNGNIGNSDNNLTTTNELIAAAGNLILDAQTQSRDNSKWNTKSYNLNYVHKFNDAGKEFSTDFYYSGNDFQANQLMSTTYLDEAGEIIRPLSSRRGGIPSLTNVYVAKADYTSQLGKKAKIETGWKSSYVEVDNNLKYDTLSGNNWVADAGTTNHFIYKEQIHASYLNYSLEVGKFKLMAGLRGEFTQTRGLQATTDSLVKRNYFQLFPSLFSTYQLNDNQSVQMSYSRRIGRPDYNALNPFRVYRDPYQYYSGNPFLRPELSNAVEVSHNFKGIFVTTFEYSYTKEAINWLMQQVASLNLTVSTRENLQSRSYLGLSVSANLSPASWWTINAYFNVFRNRFVGGNQIAVKGVDNAKTSFFGNMSNSLKIGKGFSAELSANFTSPTVYGVYRNRNVFVMSAGIQKKVLQGEATLKLAVNDLLQTRQRRNSARFDNLDFTGRVRFGSRAVNLYAYRFGKEISPSRKRQSGSEDIQPGKKRIIDRMQIPSHPASASGL